MININLWKYLPYEIKVVLYTAILTSHHKKNKHSLKYSKVLNHITEIYSKNIELRKNIDGYLKSRNEQNIRYSLKYEEYELMNRLKYLYSDDDCLSFTFFLRNVFEKLKYFDKIQSIVNPEQRFKINFNCTKIRDMYGPSVFIYYKNENSWVRFTHPLPYNSYLPIRQRDINRYQHILISHIDLTDYTIDPAEIEEAINNPIFKFSINDLEDNRFLFNGTNKTLRKYFVKELKNYKGYNHKTIVYKNIFNNEYLRLHCPFKCDSIRYNYLYNKLVFKEYYLSKDVLEIYRYMNVDYKKTKKTIFVVNEDKSLVMKNSYNDKNYYKTLWSIADKNIIEIIKEYNITNLEILLY